MSASDDIADIRVFWNLHGMNNLETLAVPVWPYVLVGAIAKLGMVGAVSLYVAATGKDLPVNSTVGTICAVAAGLSWYTRKINRPMQRIELVRFGIGTAVADMALSLLVVIAPILWIGESLSLRNIDLVLGGDGTKLTPQDIFPFSFLLIFSMLITFSTSILFAWIMTRKLPRDRTNR